MRTSTHQSNSVNSGRCQCRAGNEKYYLSKYAKLTELSTLRNRKGIDYSWVRPTIGSRIMHLCRYTEQKQSS